MNYNHAFKKLLASSPQEVKNEVLPKIIQDDIRLEMEKRCKTENKKDYNHHDIVDFIGDESFNYPNALKSVTNYDKIFGLADDRRFIEAAVTALIPKHPLSEHITDEPVEIDMWEDPDFLTALKATGVDNWPGFSDAVVMYNGFVEEDPSIN